MVDSRPDNPPPPLQDVPDTAVDAFLSADLSWFYVLRRLSRRQLAAARTFVRHVDRMETALQPLISAQKRSRFAARRARRRAEREARGGGPSEPAEQTRISAPEEHPAKAG